MKSPFVQIHGKSKPQPLLMIPCEVAACYRSMSVPRSVFSCSKWLHNILHITAVASELLLLVLGIYSYWHCMALVAFLFLEVKYSLSFANPSLRTQTL